MKRIESFLSARLFLVPQIVGDRIYFISNLNGRNSLYVMDRGGSVPEPLLPPDIAQQVFSLPVNQISEPIEEMAITI